MSIRAVLDQVEEAIDDFEGQWSAVSGSSIAELLDKYELSDDLAALAELIRVDIELRHEHGLPVRLEDYFRQHNSLLGDPELVAQIAFEDFRSRSVAGQATEPSLWEVLPGVKEQIWFQQLVRERSSLNRAAAIPARPASWAPDPPFETELAAAGFRLVQQIGEGAFSRVYLATQQELAGRFVVLKVVDQPLAEPQSMAMLQHTNIVPIYSFHRILSRSVICMPYAGSVTLRDFLQERTTSVTRGGASLVGTVRDRVHESTVSLARTQSGLHSSPSPRADGDGAPVQAEPASRIPAADDSAVLKPLEQIRLLDCQDLAVWIFARLAAALAHSHARGVLHGDLKPGNILIRNDGEPALLDFNLSQLLDRKSLQHIGGTLPYMAPETYRGLIGHAVAPSGSSDIYGLGVMLFEFVTGRLPFPVPSSMTAMDVEPALQARRGSPDWQSRDSVSPSLRSIIGHCLAFAPEDRYLTADDLRQDLECESQHNPLVHAWEPRRARLSKWASRHPRGILGAAAISLLLLLIPVAVAAANWRRQSIHLAAAAQFEAFERQSAAVLSTIMVDPRRHEEAGVRGALQPLQAFGVLDGSWQARLDSPSMTAEQRKRVRDTLLRHVAQVAFAETDRLRPEIAKGPLSGDPLRRLDELIAVAEQVRGKEPSRACLMLQSERARLAGDTRRQLELREQAERMELDSDSETYLEAVRLMANRQWPAATDMLTALADRNAIPSNLRWTMLGRSQYNNQRYEEAKISITQSIEHAPQSSRLWFMRGLCYESLGQFERAVSDYTRAVELEPSFVPAWTQRGLCQMSQIGPNEDVAGNELAKQAIADYGRALDLAPDNARVLLLRSRAYRRAGRDEDADRDYAAAMQAENQTHTALAARAQARKETDPQGALADLQQADALDPGALTVLTGMSRILTVRLQRPDEALAVLDRLLAIYPDDEPSLVDRSILLAQAGRQDEAIRDVELALVPPNESRTIYQAACMYASLPGRLHDRRALNLLARAIGAGYAADHLADDPDLESIRNSDEFQAIRTTYELSKTRTRRTVATPGHGR
jgi:serine/threonine protein kinase/tetratricopeptide (TPR) repeat protein